MSAKNTIRKTCEREGCDSQFLTSPARIANGRGKYCSPACRGGKRKVFVQGTCQTADCGANFITTEAAIAIGGGKYCSKRCYKHRKGSLADRFWTMVDKTPGQGPKGECWTFMGSLSDGYGNFKISTDKSMAAHRVAWELEHGPIPAGMCVLHKCDNRPCVKCLFLGTKADNNGDRDVKGRSWSKLTPDEVRQIRLHLQSGETLAALARTYGVSQGLIGLIKGGRRWKRL